MRNGRVHPILYLITACLLVGMVTGACAQSSQPAFTNPALSAQASNTNKVVLKVGAIQVTKSDMDNLVASQSAQQDPHQNPLDVRRAVGERYANMLVLSQAAQSKHLDSSPIFKKQMDLFKTQLLAQMEAQSVAAVTPAEVSEYYSSHQPEFNQAEYYEVAIIKKSANHEKGLSETDAQAKAQAIRKALSSGQDIKRVAQQFNAPNQVVVVTNPQVFHYQVSLPEFEKAAFSMQKGALSPLMDKPEALLFYQAEGHNQETLQEAAPQIEKALSTQKVVNTLTSLKKQTPVWMDTAYFGAVAPARTAHPQ